ALFAFDNTTSHAAYVYNALLANNMNLLPDRKQAKMRSTMYENDIKQDMYFLIKYEISELHGKPKSLKKVLIERKL
ncbi:25105_t:CDS:2, partial [Racocetra persica]